MVKQRITLSPENQALWISKLTVQLMEEQSITDEEASQIARKRMDELLKTQ